MNPMIRIHDLATGEVIDREMTKEELAAHKEDLASIAAKEEEAAIAKIEEEAPVAAAKAALLKRLGITAEEAALLLG
jgi:hypothetical protein